MNTAPRKGFVLTLSLLLAANCRDGRLVAERNRSGSRFRKT